VFPASLYTPLYHHVMLLVIIACALLYWFRPGHHGELGRFNLAATVLVCVGVVLYMGLRPVHWVFIDMGDYARSYERVQQGGVGGYNDPLFNVLMLLCSPFLSTKGWFVVCAFIYVVPLALAAWRVHGAWAFPVFLACLTAMSFWAYGVNGIRNGMATSVLILAFAFHDNPAIMFPLMAVACGIHGSVLLPAGAFFIVRYLKRTEVWLVFWAACAVTTFAAGNVGETLLSRYNPFTWDNRAEGYIVGSEGSGFRADFLAYSILPVLVTLFLAAPTRARLRRFGVRVKRHAASSWVSGRAAMRTDRVAMARAACLAGSSEETPLAVASFGHVSHEERPALQATLSALNRLSRQRQLTAAQPSTRDRPKASAVKGLSVPRAALNQNAWNRLPWVRMLRFDPFYARLVNTYLVANAVWILVIHATCSNRFAYLSWCMMPWVLVYPFVPGRSNDRPRTGILAAILFAHYMFTYFMIFVVYPLRGTYM
jgi:hypothetical protein